MTPYYYLEGEFGIQNGTICIDDLQLTWGESRGRKVAPKRSDYSNHLRWFKLGLVFLSKDLNVSSSFTRSTVRVDDSEVRITLTPKQGSSPHLIILSDGQLRLIEERHGQLAVDKLPINIDQIIGAAE